MTDTTAPALAPTARLTALRPFVVALLVGVLVVLAIGAGALYAYDRSYDGKVLAGVRVGGVDLSGQTPDEARATLADAFAAYGQGTITLHGTGHDQTVTYAEIGRGPDLDLLVAEAMAAGRGADGLERYVGNARTALAGVDILPSVRYDRPALVDSVHAIAETLNADPVDATIRRTAEGYDITPGTNGRAVDSAAAIAALEAQLGETSAPAELEADLTLTPVEPGVTTEEVYAARDAAERIAQDLQVVSGDKAWTIPGDTIRTWISFATTPDSRVVPVVSTTGIAGSLSQAAKDLKKAPKNASFLIGKGNAVVGVTAGANGRQLNIAGTTNLVADALRKRTGDLEPEPVEAAIIAVAPDLTTEDAEKSAPLMKEISRWTTYFPISEKNGYGANIWIPALDIDGYVIPPGEWFDFWKAVGPITRDRGYRDGGAIINGRTEPQGALAGGICSCSTTLFNAALRAGFEMGARKNHYYYIDRYPLGLDATVFKSGSGSVQTMSFRNDTKYPVLIRGVKIKDGSAGYVRFILYSVPSGRKVSLSKATVKNVKPATDTTEYTSSLPAGQKKRIEYPVDGKDVWVTRTVRDANGTVVHQETYYSHYSRITGVTQIGKSSSGGSSGGGSSGGGSSSTPKPTSKPTSKPTPKPTAPPPTPAPTPSPGT